MAFNAPTANERHEEYSEGASQADDGKNTTTTVNRPCDGVFDVSVSAVYMCNVRLNAGKVMRRHASCSERERVRKPDPKYLPPYSFNFPALKNGLHATLSLYTIKFLYAKLTSASNLSYVIMAQ